MEKNKHEIPLSLLEKNVASASHPQKNTPKRTNHLMSYLLVSHFDGSLLYNYSLQL